MFSEDSLGHVLDHKLGQIELNPADQFGLIPSTIGYQVDNDLYFFFFVRIDLVVINKVGIKIENLIIKIDGWIERTVMVFRLCQYFNVGCGGKCFDLNKKSGLKFNRNDRFDERHWEVNAVHFESWRFRILIELHYLLDRRSIFVSMNDLLILKI